MSIDKTDSKTKNGKPEQRSAEEIADDWYCKEYDFEEVRNTPDGKRILERKRKSFLAGYNAGVASITSTIEQLRKECNYFQDIVKESIKQKETWNKQAKAEIERLKGVIDSVKEACSDQFSSFVSIDDIMDVIEKAKPFTHDKDTEVTAED